MVFARYQQEPLFGRNNKENELKMRAKGDRDSKYVPQANINKLLLFLAGTPKRQGGPSPLLLFSRRGNGDIVPF